MPSPIGHALAGVAVAWFAEGSGTRVQSSGLQWADGVAGKPATPLTWLTLVCAALAVVPDLDLLVPFPFHRTATHSVLAAALVTIVAAAVTGWVTGRVSWRLAAICGGAYATHILLDWAGADDNPPFGIQPFWPLSDGWFIAPLVLFPGTERQDLLSLRTLVINLKAVAAELAIFGTLAAALYVRRRRKSRVRISAQAARRRPSA